MAELYNHLMFHYEKIDPTFTPKHKKKTLDIKLRSESRTVLIEHKEEKEL